jgi:hypothetical protein
VTVLKAAVTIETPPPYIDPVVTINVPSEGQSVPEESSLHIGFSVVGEGPFTLRCLVDDSVVLTNCPSGSVIDTTGLTLGGHTLKVAATDSVGTYSASRTFSIAAAEGPTYCIAIYPPPPGCPGYTGGGEIDIP